jgi:8-oxo-dGTP pyrophosphatase MutT (NUDIX family)
VREETGVEAAPVRELGEVSYFYRRAGRTVPKSVVFFLLSFVSGNIDDHDDEVEEVRWMALAEAADALTYEGEREMIGRALQASDGQEGGAGPRGWRRRPKAGEPGPSSINH